MNLSNLCGFTVAPAVQRWYFHHSRNSSLGGGVGLAETLGFCNASSSIAGSICSPELTSCGGVCRNLMTESNNCGACNNMCVGGALCVAGVCRGAAMRYVRTVVPVDTAFVDVCVAPGHSTMFASIDDASSMMMMPFEFRHWGTSVPMGSPLTINSNGYVFFGTATTTDPISGMIPMATAPNNVIAVNWNDLRTGADGVCTVVTGSAPTRRLAVHWSNARNFSATPPSQLSFEVVLNENDYTIDLMYALMNGAVASTAGLENPAGTAAIGACPAGPTVYNCVIPAATRWRFTPAM
jgi:Stigma-specific protein, Stig1